MAGDPPRRQLLGSDAYAIVRGALEERQQLPYEGRTDALLLPGVHDEDDRGQLAL